MIVRSVASMEFDFDEDCRTDSADVSSCNISLLEPSCFYDDKTTNESFLENVDNSKKGTLPKNPLSWTVDDVREWLKWTIEEFAFEPFDVGQCTLSGSEIILNGKRRFYDMLPESVSDYLWEHLMILVRNGNFPYVAEEKKRILSSRRTIPVSLRNLPEMNQPSEIGWSLRSEKCFSNSQKKSDSSVSFYNATIRNEDHVFCHTNSCRGHSFAENYLFDSASSRYHNCNDNDTQLMNFYSDDICHTRAKYSSCMYEPSLPAKQLEHSYVWFNYNNQVDSQITSTDSSCFDKQYQSEWQDSHSLDSRITVVSPHLGNGPIQLWQFLLDLLLDPNLAHVIAWTGDGWEFKLINPDKVAELWGRQKCKPKMNYEKMSRGLRYYYDKKIILKTAGKRYVYRFVCDMKQLVQCDSPQELFLKYRLSPRNDLYNF